MGRPRGPAVRLTTGINAHTISLSADGARLAYSALTSRSNVWAARVSPTPQTASSVAVPITDENQSIEGVDVSLDGRWLAYDSNRGGRQQIFKIPASGGEPIQLTRDSTDSFLPVWSPNGQEIAYHTWRGGHRDLVTMDAEGRNHRRVTTLPSHEFMPTWSPDGQHLAFIGDLSGRLELHVISRRPNGTWSLPRQITSGGVAYAPRWSPDGDSVAFSSTDTTVRIVSQRGGVSRVAFDGRPRRFIRLQAAWGDDPGTLLCHVVDRESRHEFWAIPRRGGTPRLVLRFDDLTRQPRRTDFATDGKRLYFTVATDESDVYVLQLRQPWAPY